MKFYDSEFQVRGPLLQRSKLNGVLGLRTHSACNNIADAKGKALVKGSKGGRTPTKCAAVP